MKDWNYHGLQVGAFKGNVFVCVMDLLLHSQQITHCMRNLSAVIKLTV